MRIGRFNNFYLVSLKFNSYIKCIHFIALLLLLKIACVIDEKGVKTQSVLGVR